MVYQFALRLGVGFVLLAGLLACQTNGFAPAPQVISSPSDPRSYHYIRLPNQLQVLLISDPGAAKAAASLSVNTGSKDDPVETQGLAHFLEHMLFLGTEKYPLPDEYQQFVADHGGSHNAYTAFAETNYFFDIDNASLEPALDRFAQFFVAPLLNAEYVAREVHAVDSEYRAYLKDDYRRSADVLRQVVNPLHPYAKFTVGNLDTLQGEKLRDSALAFYQQFYSANQMALVVSGDYPIEQLQQMVAQRFAAIGNNGRQLQPISQPLFSEGSLPMRLTIEPARQRRSLQLHFPLPDFESLSYDKPLSFLGNLLGHEGEGSLFQLLRQRGWAESLSAGPGLAYAGGGTFAITVGLTEAGLDQVDAITEQVFAAINLIRQQGLQAWRYREQAASGELYFNFQESANAMHYVRGLASQFGYYEPRDVVRGASLMQHFDAAEIGLFLDRLVPDNLLQIVSAPGLPADQRSPLYDVAFAQQSVGAEQLASWHQATPDTALLLPEPNPFIPQDLTLRETGAAGVVQALPAAIDLWYSRSDTFALPKGWLQLQLYSPASSASPQGQVLTQLYAALVSHRLNVQTYPALLFGSRAEVRADTRGLQLQLGGFNDTQPKLLQLSLEQLQQLPQDEQAFAVTKAQLMREWANSKLRPPYQVLMQRQRQLLQSPSWNEQQLLAAAEPLQLADLQGFVAGFWQDAGARMLLHGNYDPAEARKLAQAVADLLPGPSVQPQAMAVGQLPADQATRIVLELDHADTGWVAYVQGADDSNTERVLMGLTAQILQPAYFHQLRTEQQFGYIVTVVPVVLERMPGLAFVVQSPSRSVAEIEQASTRFLEQMAAQAATITPAEFEQQRQTLINRLQLPADNLAEQADRYWDQLLQGYYQFDRNEQLVAALQQINLRQWQEFYQRQFLPVPQRMLVAVAPGARSDQAAWPAQSVADLAAFKAGLSQRQYE